MSFTSNQMPRGIDRRTVLKGLAAAAVCGLSTGLTAAPAKAAPQWAGRVVRYLQQLARPDGGFAWPDQAESHLTPTFAVIGCCRLLGHQLPDRKALAGFVLTHHPLRRKKPERELHMFELQQIQCLTWIGEDASPLADKVRTWTKAVPYPLVYEQHGYPVFQQELTPILCRKWLGLPLTDLSPQMAEYLNERRRANGSYNNTPAADGSDGHVMNTWWGLQALEALGRLEENKAATIAWLQSCQLPGGAFTYAPKADLAATNDVIYTWAAARALRLLGAGPADREGSIRHLHALANADGGFGDRPGWPSNPLATFYALDALAALEALDASPFAAALVPPEPPAFPAGLKVFTIQLEAPGQGSPADAVELARSLGIHLWGAKNCKEGWIEAAQRVADQRKVPVRFCVANEEYGTYVTVPGLGTYSHTSDLMAPAGADFGPPMAGRTAHPWEVFRRQRLEPLQKANGRLFWQFGDNEELVRILLDDSLHRGGYAAISTFHFGNPDFINSHPFLYHYGHVLPLVALQDAHGNESWWWADMLTGFRTVFLATEPTWEGWLAAMKNRWVVSIRHDAVSEMKTWMHGGAPGVQEFVRQHEEQWRWWDSAQIRQPLLSLAAVRPRDAFEAGRPEKGIALRVRCRWDQKALGAPKTQVAELVSLVVDNQRVEPKAVKMANDHYYHLEMAEVATGPHTATATARIIGTKDEQMQTIQF